MKESNGVSYYHFVLKGGKTLMHDGDRNRYLFSNPLAKYCPVAMTSDYFRRLGPGYQGTVIPLCSPSNPNLPAAKPQGYSSCLQDLHFVLKQAGIEAKTFTEHSMRRGGATEAANHGATVEEITKAGSWSHHKTAELYIDDRTTYQRRFSQFLRS